MSRILIAEDETRLAAFVEKGLRSNGFTTTTVSDGPWGYDYDPGSNVVDVYVGYLRRKVGRERIQTVRGMGYLLSA